MDRILVVGAAVVDVSGVGIGPLVAGDSNPGAVHLSVGGVAKNIAEDLTRLSAPVSLLTFFGNDHFSALIRDHLARAGIDCSHSPTIFGPSGNYVSLHHADGVLVAAVNDFRIMEALVPADFDAFTDYIDGFDWLVLDANLPAAVLDRLTYAYRHKKIVVDGVSRAKVGRIKPYLGRIFLLKVNRGELAELCGGKADDVIEAVRGLLATGVKTIVVTNGAEPITYNIERRIFQTSIYAAKHPVSSSGCGDALVAGTVYGLVRGLSMHAAVNWGKKAASFTMETADPCHPMLNPKILDE